MDGKLPALVRNGMALGIDSGLVVVATVAVAVGWESEIVAIAVLSSRKADCCLESLSFFRALLTPLFSSSSLAALEDALSAASPAASQIDSIPLPPRLKMLDSIQNEDDTSSAAAAVLGNLLTSNPLAKTKERDDGEKQEREREGEDRAEENLSSALKLCNGPLLLLPRTQSDRRCRWRYDRRNRFA
nr:hypothetical protein Iba_chr09bCG1660 [Ipomoea batatas]